MIHICLVIRTLVSIVIGDGLNVILEKSSRCLPHFQLKIYVFGQIRELMLALAPFEPNSVSINTSYGGTNNNWGRVTGLGRKIMRTEDFYCLRVVQWVNFIARS